MVWFYFVKPIVFLQTFRTRRSFITEPIVNLYNRSSFVWYLLVFPVERISTPRSPMFVAMFFKTSTKVERVRVGWTKNKFEGFPTPPREWLPNTPTWMASQHPHVNEAISWMDSFLVEWIEAKSNIIMEMIGKYQDINRVLRSRNSTGGSWGTPIAYCSGNWSTGVSRRGCN